MSLHPFAYKQLIEYFDVLRPILLLDLTICKAAYDKFLGLTGVVDLDEFDSTVDESLEYFPDYVKEVTPLIHILAQNKIMIGLRVFLLDVLTSLVILVRGDIREKSYLLFKWYNFSKTNLLSELEHTLLIMRASSCMHKLKLIGLIEITKEDAKYIALSARVANSIEDPKIRFNPGLYLSDFTSWIVNGHIGKTFVKAFRVLERLSDTLVTLQNKATALHNIVSAKLENSARQLYFPTKDVLRTIENLNPVILLHRGETRLSIAVISQRRLGQSPMTFVHLKKEIPMDNPLFSIPENAIDRVIKKDLLLPGCCHKYYVLETFRKIPMFEVGDTCVARIDINDLEKCFSYSIMPYTEYEHFKTVHVAVQSSENLQRKVIILPGSVRIGDINSILREHIPMGLAANIIYSGTIVPADEIFETFSYQTIGEVDYYTAQLYCSSLKAQLMSHYATYWPSSLLKLFGILDASCDELSDSFDRSISAASKHIYLMNGFGPWASRGIRDKLKQCLQGFHNVVFDALEDLYSQYIAAIQVVEKSFQVGPVQVFMVQDWAEHNVDRVDPSNNGSNFDGSAEALISSLEKLLANDAICDYEDASALSKISHIAIVVRTPASLLENVDWGEYTKDNNPDQNNVVQAKRVTKVEPQVSITSSKLRGKHELIHGEYSELPWSESNRGGNGKNYDDDDSVMLDNRTDKIEGDKTFLIIVSLLIRWLRNSCDRCATIFSTGWEDGFNFEIVQKVVKDNSKKDVTESALLRIQHQNLLVTGKTFSQLLSEVVPRAPKMRFDTELKKWFKIPEPEVILLPRSAHRILRRVERSLSAEDFQFRILEGTNYDRTVVFEERETCADDPCPSQSILRLIPFQSASASSSEEKCKTHQFLEYWKTALCINSPPKVISVTHDSFSIQFGVLGVGIATCSLFEFPVRTRLSDAISIFGSEERSLTVPEQVEKRRSEGGKQLITVTFARLKSNAVYAVHVEPSPDIPHAVHVRTLSNTDGNAVSRCALAGYTSVDEVVHTSISHRIRDAIDSLRSSIGDISLLHREIFGPYLRDLDVPTHMTSFCPGIEQFDRIAKASAVYKVVPWQHIHRGPHLRVTPHLSDIIKITYNCKFCTISALTDDAVCLVAIAAAVEYIQHTSPSIVSICIHVPKPLIRCLTRAPNGTWKTEDFAFSARRYCVELIASLLRWKSYKSGRDAQIITIMDTNRVQCATYGLISSDSIIHAHPVKAIRKHRSHNTSGVVRHHHHSIASRSHSHIHRHSTHSQHNYHHGQHQAHQRQHQTVHRKLSHASSQSEHPSHLQGSTPSENDHKIGGQPNEQDATETKKKRLSVADGPTIRHLILPMRFYFQKGNSANKTVFPCGTVQLGQSICYTISEVLEDSKESKECQLVNVIPPFGYQAIPSSLKPESVAYVVETLLDSDEYRGLVSVDEASVVGGGGPLISTDAKDSLVIVQSGDQQPKRTSISSQHTLVVRQFLHGNDLLQVIFGPLIGLVTANSAVVLIEVNRDIQEFRCTVRKIGDSDTPGISLQLPTKAYQVSCYKFTDLESNCVYEIYFPDLSPKSFGYFRTHQNSPQYCEIAVTGGCSLKDLPILVDAVQQLQSQPMASISNLLVMARYLHGANVAFSEEAKEVGDITFRQLRNKFKNSWIKLSEYLRQPTMTTGAVFHLGSFSLLAQNMNTLAKRLLEHAKRLQLPVRDATGMSALWFHQLEEYIKDSFRLMLMAPSIQDALAVCSHLPTYTSDILLPLDKLLEDEIASDENEAKLLQIIRKVFETQYLAYVAPLYGLTPNAAHHSRVWRMGSLAVVVLDTVSDRRKVKKKKIGEDDSETPTVDAPKATKASSNPFSLGFIEKNQWKLLKDLSQDSSIIQMFICTEFPILPLRAIPTEYVPPVEVSKGHILEWGPTSSDLDIFVQHWIQWMSPSATGENPPNRCVTFISAACIPHVSVMQDMPTGLSIKQLCVGNFNGNAAESIKSLDISAIEIVGKFGTVRYVHRFKNLDNIVIDSERDSLEIEMDLTDQFLQSCCNPNYATLRFWFDSWKPSGLWAINVTGGEKAAQSPDGCVVLGPIVGAPYLVKGQLVNRDNTAMQMMMVPVLLEVDKACVVTLEGSHVFKGEGQSWTFELESYVPKVIVLGPFELETRYSFKFIEGLAAAASYAFTLDTYINWSEANVAILNCTPATDTIPCSDYLKDIINHGRVPFSGLTAIVEINMSPSEIEINNIKKSNVLQQGLTAWRQTGDTSPAFRQYLCGLINTIRQLFRNLLCRPSYKELFKTTYNLFVFQSKHAKPSSEHVESEESIENIKPEEYEEYVRMKQLRLEKKAVAEDAALFVDWLVLMVHNEYLGALSKYSYDFPDAAETIRSMFVNRAVTVKPKGTKTNSIDPSTMQLLDEVVINWKSQTKCAALSNEPYISPNGLLCIEVVDYFNKENIQLVARELQQFSSLQVGNRILIVDDDSVMELEHGDLEEDISDVYMTFQDELVRWIQGRADRSALVVCPSGKFGSRQMFSTSENASKTLYCPLFYVDSVFRSIERDKERQLLAKALAIKNQVISYAAGKTSKAQKKQEEEFKRLMALQKEQVLASFADAAPDGYLLVESRTSLFETSSTGKTNIISTLRAFVMNSAVDPDNPDIPTIFDYIQFPQWMQKVLPSRDGPFIQDEVYLSLKSEQRFQRVIEYIEGSELIPSIRMLYESSRLSELSRPADMREIDMSKPGVTEQFTRDLFKQVYRELIPNNIKTMIVPFTDDFILSLLFSRTLADTTPLNSPESFAAVVQRCLVIALAMKHSFDVKDLKRYSFLYDLPDKATVYANKIADQQKRLHLTHQRAKVRNPVTYDADQVERDFFELEESIDELRAMDGGESDMEQLIKEEVQSHILDERERILNDLAQREKEMEAIENDRLEAEAKGTGDAGKADQLAEMKKTRVQFNKLLDEALAAAFDKLLEDTYSRQEEVAIVEQQKEAQLTITMSLMGGQETQDEKDIREARIQQTALITTRRELRRLLGARLTYLQPKLL